MKAILNIDQLNEVTGGGIFSVYRDKEYAAAGVTVLGPGVFYNDGYQYNGQNISMEEANWLVYFYKWNHRRASSIEEAKRYYKENSYEVDYLDH